MQEKSSKIEKRRVMLVAALAPFTNQFLSGSGSRLDEKELDEEKLKSMNEEDRQAVLLALTQIFIINSNYTDKQHPDGRSVLNDGNKPKVAEAIERLMDIASADLLVHTPRISDQQLARIIPLHLGKDGHHKDVDGKELEEVTGTHSSCKNIPVIHADQTVPHPMKLLKRQMGKQVIETLRQIYLDCGGQGEKFARLSGYFAEKERDITIRE